MVTKHKMRTYTGIFRSRSYYMPKSDQISEFAPYVCTPISELPSHISTIKVRQSMKLP